MMFEKRKLGDIYTFQYGTGNTIEDTGGDYPIYGSNGPVGFTDKYNSEDSPVIGHIGAYAGIVNWASGKHFVTYNGVICTAKDGVDKKFAYYTLLNANLTKRVRGSTQPFVSYDLLQDVDILLPEINEQCKISKVLSSIDDKISTNNKIIETSEKLMREIYDYWFVQFDFPDENGRPYKSSGGEMVYDETLKREIPKGWKAIDLSDLVKNRTEATIGTHDDKCIDLSIMPSGSIVLDKYNFGDSFGSNMKTMKKGDILFGSIRPYLRKAGIAPYDGVRAGTVHCFYTKNIIDSSMCSVMMTSEDMFQYAIMKSGGSTRMPSVSAKDILLYSFAYNQEVSSKYNDICSDLINQIILLINENISLASLRDWLLPMLMNGQIKVSD